LPEIEWEFDVKDPAVALKYGNFSSPTVIKLASKFNKAALAKGEAKADASKIAAILAEELNLRLEDDEHGYTLVHSEVLKFDTINGFLNIFLQNEQFMDRVQLMIRKKHLTYKEGEFGHHSDEVSEPAFVVIKDSISHFHRLGPSATLSLVSERNLEHRDRAASSKTQRRD
jgi:hypothetical protein